MGIVLDPADLDIVIPQGATFRLRFQWLTDGAPVDLTGAEVRGQIRQDFRKPVLGTLVCSGDADGHIIASLSAAATAAIPAVEAKWDLEIEWPDHDVVRLLMGKCLISPEVTR